MTDIPCKPLPSVDRVRQVLDYDPLSGTFRWRCRTDSPRFSARWAGVVAGKINGSGHVEIKMDYVQYAAHRLAWLFVNGEEPSGFIDHIDMNPANNAIANLRIATKTQNRANALPPKNNTSGVRGVFLCSKTGRWIARISAGGRRRHLGSFASKDRAREAYEIASLVVYGEYSRTASAILVSAKAGVL